MGILEYLTAHWAESLQQLVRYFREFVQYINSPSNHVIGLSIRIINNFLEKNYLKSKTEILHIRKTIDYFFRRHEWRLELINKSLIE